MTINSVMLYSLAHTDSIKLQVSPENSRFYLLIFRIGVSGSADLNDYCM